MDRAIQAAIVQGLPRLEREMTLAGITTPRRKAAFLATLAHESGLRWNRLQEGSDATYRGRGYIQLTGKANYQSAGNWLGEDLVTNYEWARSEEFSAEIARWYWTVARKISPLADRLAMGEVCKAIGYDLGDGSEDKRRTQSFADALLYLTGSVPDGITSTR
jgi:putative chitinase